MTEQEAIKDSIAHWERMVEWAATQRPTDPVLWGELRVALDEVPDAEDCALCDIYNAGLDGGCTECPLAAKHGDCGSSNAYSDVDDARQWTEFIKHGNRLIEQLKSLL